MSEEALPEPRASSPTQNGQNEEEEEDYMSMAIVEPTKPFEKETYTQRRIRKQRESELKNPKSKSELAAAAESARSAALATSIPQSSKGYKMLSKLGFQEGTALGSKNNLDARLEPIGLEMKDNRGGIGLDTEKKRKFREEAESEAKRVKAEEGDFRERIAKEREAERLERQVGAAMRVAERMDEEEGGEGVAAEMAPVIEEKEGLVQDTVAKPKAARVPLKQINVLWRGLARERELKERERRMRYDLLQSLSRNASYNDPNDDEQEKQAFGVEEESVEEEDPELEEFQALEPAERLQKLVEYLRERYHYCFWCKYRYEDEKMEGCPGLTEEDHD